MSIPFHKQTCKDKLAGQIVYPLPETPAKQAGQITYKITVVDNAYPNGIPYEEWVKPPQPIKVEVTLNDLHKQETTLAQYIERKTDEPKRITFDEWSTERFGGNLRYSYINNFDSADMLECWNAALKQGKL